MSAQSDEEAAVGPVIVDSALPQEIVQLHSSECLIDGAVEDVSDAECEELHQLEEISSDISISQLEADIRQRVSCSSTPTSFCGDYTLEMLPPELILKICSFIEAKYLLTSFIRVCKYFHGLISESTYWKLRIAQKWSNSYPAIPNEKFSRWCEGCVEREMYHDLWSDKGRKMNSFRLKGSHISAVDTVHFLDGGNLAVSGSRDRSLCLWRVSALPDDDDQQPDMTDIRISNVLDAHKGWIWCAKSVGSTLYTGSWDTHLKLWDFSTMQTTDTFKCRSAVLCLSTTEDMASVGTFFKTVICYDPRAGHNVLKEYTPHKKPVLCMSSDERYIITGSEDATLAVYCKRTGHLRKINMKNFPMSMSYGGGQLWVGDKRGRLHLLDAQRSRFTSVLTYDLGGNRYAKVTDLRHTMGAVVAGTTDKQVYVLDPGRPPRTVTAVDDFNSEVSAIDLCGKVVVSGTSDSTVRIFTPKQV